ncbi:MAG: hypothetical protein LBT78_04130 [Tannerella sp.]|jgi:hypothetical protein|nr:hypothetical protein [Tannerella sp.]
MNTNRTEYEQRDILKTMFARLPDETLSPAFLAETMQRIRKEAVRIRKRDEWLCIAALVAASSAIVGLAVATFIYMDVPQIEIDFPRIDFSRISISPFYLLIGGLSLVLLLADSLFRQMYYKKHPERI